MVFAACLLIVMAAAASVLAQADGESDCDAPAMPAPLTFGLTDAPNTAVPCLIGPEAMDLAGWRSRLAIALMAGSYANAVADYTQLGVALQPEMPDVFDQLIAGYEAQLAGDPGNPLARMSLAFAQWRTGDYANATSTLDPLLADAPDHAFGLLFRGSSRLYLGQVEAGEADLARALERMPHSADAHFIAADAYAFAIGDFERAGEQAALASDMGLETPGLNHIRAVAARARDDEAAAALYTGRHIEAVTTEYVDGEALAAGGSMTLDFAPGRTFRVPLRAEAGETVRIAAESDSGVSVITVLLGPDGALLASGDPGIERALDTTGDYLLIAGTVEGAGRGEVVLVRE
jgi:Tfp pilus assembly protein PilF